MKISLFKQILEAARVDLDEKKIILVVEDNTLLKFYKEYNLTEDSFLKSPLLSDFVENHVVTNLRPKTEEAIMSSGQVYSYTKKGDKRYIGGELILDRIDEGPVTFLVLSNVLVPELMKKEVLLAKLPYDIFVKIILDNKEIRGKNLLSLCLSSEDINAKCNHRDQDLFRRLLESDFGIVNETNSRAKYVELSKSKIVTIQGMKKKARLRDLEGEIRRYGHVVSLNVIGTKIQVGMKTRAEAEAVVAGLNGTRLDGYLLSVKIV